MADESYDEVSIDDSGIDEEELSKAITQFQSSLATLMQRASLLNEEQRKILYATIPAIAVAFTPSDDCMWHELLDLEGKNKAAVREEFLKKGKWTGPKEKTEADAIGKSFLCYVLHHIDELTKAKPTMLALVPPEQQSIATHCEDDALLILHRGVDKPVLHVNIEVKTACTPTGTSWQVQHRNKPLESFAARDTLFFIVLWKPNDDTPIKTTFLKATEYIHQIVVVSAKTVLKNDPKRSPSRDNFSINASPELVSAYEEFFNADGSPRKPTPTLPTKPKILKKATAEEKAAARTKFAAAKVEALAAIKRHHKAQKLASYAEVYFGAWDPQAIADAIAKHVKSRA